MIKALLLIFRPARTWDDVFEAQRGVAFVFFFYFAPLMLMACALEGAGMVQWGKVRGMFPRLEVYSPAEATAFQVLQFAAGAVTAGLAALFLRVFARTFHSRHGYREAFAVIAYGMGPFFLARFLDASPALPSWVSWAAGVGLSVAALYQGVPRVMKPDPPSAFGLFLLTSVVLVFLTALWRFLVFWYLLGRFPAMDSAVRSLGSWLPF